MKQQQESNPCVRCGQERVTVKTWKEKVGTSLITYTLTKCPDSKCQEIVDRNNALREEKRLLHAQKRPAFKRVSLSNLSKHK